MSVDPSFEEKAEQTAPKHLVKMLSIEKHLACGQPIMSLVFYSMK